MATILSGKKSPKKKVKQADKGFAWNKYYECCVECGTTKVKHNSKGRCGTCASKLWARNNKERYRKLLRKSYLKNHEKNLSFAREYYLKNREMCLEKMRKYTKDTTEKTLENRRFYRKDIQKIKYNGNICNNN